MSAPVLPPNPILLVDDEESVLDSASQMMRSAGISNSLKCTDSQKVLAILRAKAVEAVVLDLWMPNVTGQELLPLIVLEFPEVPVIIMTAASDIDDAVECMRLGAFDFMTKPVDERQFIAKIRKAIEVTELRRENARLRAGVLSTDLENPEVFAEIVTNHESMIALFRYAETVAASPRPVLITGETGVGKELFAKVVHKLSGRTGAFVPANMAGLDDTLFTDTLFGHQRGAFTGADQAREGLVEMASGGTLFLDEIGDLSPSSQAKLLRLLQETEYFPLGSDVAKRANIRIVAATHCDLPALQSSGAFRKDLYYRLRTHPLNILPLRERLDDLPFLVEHFLAESATTLKKDIPAYPEELYDLLGAYHFPGNVRELQAMVFNALSAHHSGVLSLKNIQEYIWETQPQASADKPPIRRKTSMLVNSSSKFPTLKEASQELITEAMRRANGNQTVAAKLLGISRQALNNRLKRADD